MIVTSFVDLQCPFPFEGNGNLNKFGSHSIPICLQCPFPFEGNGNCTPSTPSNTKWWLTMSFPVWREWKPIHISPRMMSDDAYNVLSRLKGIETQHPRWRPRVASLSLQCPFPFEGNGNILMIPTTDNFSGAYNVLSRLKGMETPLAASRVMRL